MFTAVLRFLVKYIIVAVIGTAVICIGAPFLRTGADVDYELDNLGRDLFGKPLGEVIDIDILQRPGTRGFMRRTRAKIDSLMDSPVSEPVVREIGWAVVKSSDSRLYSHKGVFLGRLDPGSCVEVSSLETTQLGRVAVCSPVDGKHQGDVCVVFVADLLLRRGKFADRSSEEYDTVRRMAGIMADLERISLNREKIVASHNPHAAEYTRVKAEYTAFWREVKSLQSRRDNTTGAERIRCADELRRMKGEDLTLGRRFEKCSTKYEEWQSANLKNPEYLPDTEAMSAELVKLTRHLTEIDEAGEGNTDGST